VVESGRGENKKKFQMSIRRGIPLALFLVFSSALIFQMFLYTYVISLMREGNKIETLRTLTAISSRLDPRLVDKGLRVSSEGRVVRFFSDIPSLEKFIAKEAPMAQELTREGDSFCFSSGNREYFVIPVRKSAGPETSYLLVVIPSALDRGRIALIVGGISLTFIMVLFGFTLLVFSRYLFSPLGAIVNVVERFEKGEGCPEETLELPSNELGKLGDVLISAFSSLEGKRRQLEEMVAALREANEELKRSRSQIVRMEKLATIGRLASGIAHEVGNPLMSIKGYAEYLLSNTELDEEQRDCLERVVKESERIEGIVKGLLQHARVEVRDKGEADVNAVLKDILDSLAYRKISENIELEVQPGDIPPARISEEKLRQVLVNVILNALDAMPDGGELRIATRLESVKRTSFERPRRRRTDPPDADFSGVRKDALTSRDDVAEYVLIEVSDTGVGIEPSELDKIFDPFYTTKEPGRGTGLGLSISSAILNTYNGFMECESNPGEGSTFRVFIPASTRT